MNLPDAKSAEFSGAPREPEVKVRTFASDLISLRESGGGLPQFRAVKAPTLHALGQPVEPPLSISPHNKLAPFFIFGAIFFLLLGVVGYLLYRILSSHGTPTNLGLPGGNAEGTGAAGFAHVSVFRTPAEQKISFTLGQDVAGGSSPEAYRSGLQDALGRASLSAKFFEVELVDAAGKSVGARAALGAADALVLDGQLLADHFQNDVTFFIYRSGGGLFPGYVLSPKQSEDLQFLASESAKLEAARALGNFPIPPLGEVGPFSDGTAGGLAVREARFSGGGSASGAGASFVYGWARGRLVLSSSREGFIEAAGRL